MLVNFVGVRAGRSVEEEPRPRRESIIQALQELLRSERLLGQRVPQLQEQ